MMAFLTGSRLTMWLQRTKPASVVGAVLAVERGLIAVDVELHPPAVEFDFVEPFRPAGGIFASVGAIGLINGTLRSMRRCRDARPLL